MYRPFLGGKTFYIVVENGNIGKVVTCTSFPDERNIRKADTGSVPVCKVRICDSERQVDKDRRGAIDRIKYPPTNVHIRVSIQINIYWRTTYTCR